MAIRLSRRRIAAHVASALLKSEGRAAVVKDVAAYLVATRRTRELELLVRDIEDALARRGTVVADVVSAHPLSASLRQEIAALAGGNAVQLRETVDPRVLGGVRIDLPGKRFDGTLRRRLMTLKEAKQI